MNRWYYRGGQNDCDTYTGCVKWGMGGVGWGAQMKAIISTEGARRMGIRTVTRVYAE